MPYNFEPVYRIFVRRFNANEDSDAETPEGGVVSYIQKSKPLTISRIFQDSSAEMSPRGFIDDQFLDFINTKRKMASSIEVYKLVYTFLVLYTVFFILKILEI